MINPKVYCIIVTYNAMRWIDNCLQSLRESNTKLYLVVIDNCSKDDTIIYLKHNYPEVHLIINQKNKGFGQANNQGIEYAYAHGATHFFLLNQDAWIHPDTIDKLITIQEDNDLALVSPIHLNGKGNLLDRGFYSSIILMPESLKLVSDLTLNNLSPYYEVFKINAAAWMLSRKTIEFIGGFDPVFFHYGEDGNYSQRIHYHGGRIAFVPGAYINHDRVLQGNMQVFKKQEIAMMLLYYYCDINTSIFKPTKEKVEMHLEHIIVFIKFLFTFKFKNIMNLLKGYVEFLCKMPRIFKSKKQNKIIGHNWLNLNS